MSLSDEGIQAQALECLAVARKRQSEAFFINYGPLIKEAVEKFGVDLERATQSKGNWIDETRHEQESTIALEKGVAYWFGLALMEHPSLNRSFHIVNRPQGLAELLLYTDSVIDLLEEHGEGVYSRDEAVKELQGLQEDARRELAYEAQAEETYHWALAEKNASRERIRTLVRGFKSGVRRLYGVESPEYRMLRDSTFRSWNVEKERTFPEPTA